MITLTDRLKSMAKEIKRGETMADIGTDHGLLPLYLWENDICPDVVMTDVNSGPVKIAEKNAKLYNPDFEFDIRQGNGLEVLNPYEVDNVVIAGMGGMLIAEIIGKDIEKSFTFKKFILQPRSKQSYLRHFLLTNGFRIKKEKLVVENGNICSIIVAVPGDDSDIPDFSAFPVDSMFWEIPVNIDHKNALYEQFLIDKYRTEKMILNSMLSGNRTDDESAELQRKRILYIKQVLDDERFFYSDEDMEEETDESI